MLPLYLIRQLPSSVLLETSHLRVAGAESAGDWAEVHVSNKCPNRALKLSSLRLNDISLKTNIKNVSVGITGSHRTKLEISVQLWTQT